jgi:hypothetical protein
MQSSAIEQLKSVNTSDAEVAQLVRLKQARIADDTCVSLVSASHESKHPFTSADSTVSLAAAGFSELQILEIARTDQLDFISGDAVTLRLIGLSDSTVQTVLQRRLQRIPTLGSAEIARLKNTGLTERQILDRINQGMSDEQADKEVARRELVRNHSSTGFTRIHGRRPR